MRHRKLLVAGRGLSEHQGACRHIQEGWRWTSTLPIIVWTRGARTMTKMHRLPALNGSVS